MIRTWSLQKFLRLTKKGWNAYNLFIWQSRFWPIYHRQLTDFPQTINGQRISRVLAAISTEISADSRSICRPWLGRYLSWYIGRHINQHISVFILAKSRSICRPTYRLSVSGQVNRYIGTSIDTPLDRFIGWGVHKIHMIPLHPRFLRVWVARGVVF